MKYHLYTICLSAILSVFTVEYVFAQPIEFSLEQTIEKAQKASLDNFRAKYMYRAKELNYLDFMMERRPRLGFQLTPFNYTRSIVEEYNSERMQYEPVEIQRLTSQYNLNVTQAVALTGGDVTVYSGLMRSQRFGGNFNNNLDYISTPLSVAYRQNFSRINEYKWNSKIEPMKFEQAKLEFTERQEEIAVKAVSLFFSHLTAQMNFDIALLNRDNAYSLLDMGRKREKIGSISVDELLNLELKQINAEISVAQARNKLEDARLDFCEFLELPVDTRIRCIAPEEVRLMFIDPDQAQQLAVKNNPDSHNLALKFLEVQKQLSAAKRRKYDINMEAGVGWNQNREVFSEAYQDLMDRQNFRVSFSIPILDWQENKRRVERASLNQQLTERENKKIKEQLAIEVVKTVNEFNIKYSQLNSAAQADTISQRAYEATQQLFSLGKANVIAINEAYRAMYSARNQYFNALNNYWLYYYTIRKLCLFDFEKNTGLTESTVQETGTKF